MCFIFYEYSNMILVLFFTCIPFYSHLKKNTIFLKKYFFLKIHKLDKIKTRLDEKKLIESFLIRLFLILD